MLDATAFAEPEVFTSSVAPSTDGAGPIGPIRVVQHAVIGVYPDSVVDLMLYSLGCRGGLALKHNDGNDTVVDYEQSSQTGALILELFGDNGSTPSAELLNARAVVLRRLATNEHPIRQITAKVERYKIMVTVSQQAAA